MLTFIQRHVCIDDAFSDICVIQEANFNLRKAISVRMHLLCKTDKKKTERQKKRETEEERVVEGHESDISRFRVSGSKRK